MTTTNTLSEEHAEWLETTRGIPVEVAAEAGLWSDGRNLVFPYKRQGDAFSKIRGPQKRFWMDPAGARLCLWNIDQWRDVPSDTLIVTEGEIDALSWMAAGAACVTSVPNGASSDKPGEGDIDPRADTRFSYLWEDGRLLPELARFKRIVLSTDADTKGQVLRDELSVRLGRERCWFVTYPDGCKDANDVLVQHGIEAIGKLLDGARPMVPDVLVPFSEIPERLQVSYSTGWSEMDPGLRLYVPELVTFTGPPMAGKSQFALALAANMARVHRMRIALLQFEDDPERNRRDLLRYAKAWQEQTQGVSITMPPMHWVDTMFRTIALSEDRADDVRDMTWLETRIEEAATRHDCQIVIIDPWNEVEHLWQRQQNEATYLNSALRKLKAMSRRLRIGLWIVAHPDKSAGRQNTSVHDWSAYDIAGGAVWNNKSDHVVVVFRQKGEEDTFVKIAKSKNWDTGGIPSTWRMRFNRNNATFEMIGKESE